MKKQLDCKIPKSTWNPADTRQSAGREFPLSYGGPGGGACHGDSACHQYGNLIERAVPVQVISVARGFVLIIPMAFVLAALAGVTGVWLAFPVTEGIVCLVGAGMCWRMKNSMIP